MGSITRREELIMLSILNLKDDAYLIAIKNHLSAVTENKKALRLRGLFYILLSAFILSTTLSYTLSKIVSFDGQSPIIL